MATFIVQAISTSRAVAASDNHDNILLQKSIEKKIIKSYSAVPTRTNPARRIKCLSVHQKTELSLIVQLRLEKPCLY